MADKGFSASVIKAVFDKCEGNCIYCMTPVWHVRIHGHMTAESIELKNAGHPMMKNGIWTNFYLKRAARKYLGKTKRVEMHVDHYWPKSKGGSDDLSNLVAACATCNLSKGAKDPLTFTKSRRVCT